MPSLRREDRPADAPKAAPVRLVRLRPVVLKRVPRRLGNPFVELYREVTNRRATWVDAIFWLVLGIVGQTLGNAVWEALKQ